MKSRLVLVVVGALVALASVSGPGCTVFNGLVADTPDAGTTDVGPLPEASSSTSSSGGTVCGKLPPARVIAEGGDRRSFLFAVRTFKLKSPADAGASAIGYNLDQTCGCQPSCKPPAGASAPCDDEQTGIDNVAVNFSYGKLDFPSTIEARSNDNLGKGDNGLLIELADYNGQADDSSVTLRLRTSQGTRASAAAGAPQIRPKFDGTDIWSVETTEAQAVPAYVRDFVIVADNIEQSAIRIDADVQIRLNKAVFTAKLVPKDQTFELRDGIFAGSWPIVEALKQIGRLSLESGKPPLCEDALTMGAVTQLACSAVDMRERTPNAELLCNALSVAMGFDAVPALLGAGVDPEPVTKCIDKNFPPCP
jgi:hypothetical protein